MSRFKTTCYLVCCALLLMICGALVTQPIAWAVSEGITKSSSLPPEQTSPESEEIKLTCQYPVLSSYAGTVFSYSIDLNYKGGKEPRVFDLKVDIPAGFNYTIMPSYGEGSEIAAIRLDPQKTYSDTIKVTVRPYIWLTPKPGEYAVTVKASSGKISDSIQLKAIVTAKYDIELKSATGRLNTEATAGKDNYFTVVVTNSGSAVLDNVTLSSKAADRPSGWSLTFKPEKIDSLPVGSSKEVEVDIKPQAKTISGDYMVPVEVEPESRTAWAKLDIRVTVLTPTIWGWVGVGIVVVVIVGLAVMFMRLGRR